MSGLNKKEKLIHDILFSSVKNFRVKLDDYVNEHEREQFCRDIRKAIHLSGMEIIYTGISMEDKITYWKITLK
jgi:hypothetical protein